MKNNDLITGLCRKYSYLTTEDIVKIKEVAASLPLMSRVQESDIFIDVMSRENDVAIVLAEALLEEGKSLYSSSVIGKKALRINEPAVIRTLETGVPSKDIRALTQENRFVKQSVHPIKSNDEKIIAVLITEKDISSEIREDFEIDHEMIINKKSKSYQFMNILNSNKLIHDNLDDAILIFDKNGFLAMKNTKAIILYSALGYMQEIQGMHYDNLSLDNKSFNHSKEELLFKEDKRLLREVKVGKSYYRIKTILINEDDLRIINIVQDITDIKNKEAEIVSKSVAIREIHHRVKNNLQTVAALLRIQGRRCKTEEAKIALQESVNRILAISATHELLSKQIDDEINIMDVINSIVSNAKRCFNNTSKSINIEVKGEDFYIDSDRITSISLIINELIQNCYDHAFKGRTEGNIFIIIDGDEEYKVISVNDDGVGFDKGKNNTSSLGLTIVNSYVKDKLNGSIEVKSDKQGTEVSITFQI